MSNSNLHAPSPELTSVSDTEAVFHLGEEVRTYDDLAPDSNHELEGMTVRTLPQPGDLLCRFATVNDVHFGEVAAGMVGDTEGLHALGSAPGEEPYPEMMNRAAISEIAEIEPAAVVAKGDLTTRGTPEEYQLFLDHYGEAFGDRLTHVRGNHDAYSGETHAANGPVRVELPGVTLAVLDTVIPTETTGQITNEQLEWLGDLAADSEGPLLVFGHHQTWMPGSKKRSPDYFGINPDDSEALVSVIEAHHNIHGYFAGHTHRNRVRLAPQTGKIPFVEVACVKDYPGTWAEYRVFDGGILQVHRRISTPVALAWSDRCRKLYAPMIDYTEYALGPIDHRCFLIDGTR